jgi:hypothetical protein
MHFGLNKKAQVAMEFMILIGFLMFVFSMIFISIHENMNVKTDERKNLMVKQVAIEVQDEINLASQSIDGYRREFWLPYDLSGENYTVVIVDDLVSVKTFSERHAVALPVLNVSGMIIKGNNVITKKNGEVNLNE